MADAAEAIINGIDGSDIIIITRGMCWFHCKKSVDKQIIIELNQLTHSQGENIDRAYSDRLYCNKLDVSLMNNDGSMS